MSGQDALHLLQLAAPFVPHRDCPDCRRCRIDAYLTRTPSPSEAAIKHMVSRFLSWRLPENFRPDAGISFKADFNEGTPWPMKHEPLGTNLFDGEQAEAMIRHMLEGLAHPAPSPSEGVRDNLAHTLRQIIGDCRADGDTSANLTLHWLEEIAAALASSTVEITLGETATGETS